jgi:hypothetical protein
VKIKWVPYVLALVFGAMSASAVSPPTGLRVLLATLDIPTHQVTLQLNNSTDKTVVAYVLETKGYDADGKQVEDGGGGWDFLAMDPNSPDIARYIPPGRTITTVTYVSPQSLSVIVSVMGVVYLDRTLEGIAGTVFDAPSRQAKVARQALVVLKSYPESPQDTRRTMQKLLKIGAPLIDAALANNLHLSVMPDADHPPAKDSFPKQAWESVKTELAEKAIWFETQSQPENPSQEGKQ